MKFVFPIVFVIFINTVKSHSTTNQPTINQSTTEIPNGCHTSSRSISCWNFQHTYLPYVESLNQITSLWMHGNFSELVIDSAYENLEDIDILSTNLQTLKFEKYASFTKLSSVAVSGSKQVIEVDFTGVEKLKRLIWVEIDFNQMVKYLPNFCESFQSSNIERIGLAWNKFDSFDFSCVPRTIKTLGLHYNKISSLGSLDSQNCKNMKSLSTLTYLYLSGNYFTDFNFACLPQNLINLVLYNNQISTISNESCQSLKNLTSLRRISLQSNNLQHFQFGCLPTSIEYVDLRKNNITEINDLSDVPHSHPVNLEIHTNPIRCTCSLLRDYVQLLDSGNVTFVGGYEEPYTTITCANVDNELAAYPWGNDAEAIRSYDASSLGCLTSENIDRCGNKLGESDSDQCTYMHIMSMCSTTTKDFGVVVLTCNSFQHTYLPYVEKLKQITHLWVDGNFSELVIDPAYENLEYIYTLSTNLQTLKFEKYASFTKLRYVAVAGGRKRVVNVDFTGVEKLKRLHHVQIDLNKMVKFRPNFCKSFKSSNIEHITLSWNKFVSFDFSCVPRTIKAIDLSYNKIPSLGLLDSQTCENMKSLSSLTDLNLSGNKLTDFNFACLPKSLVRLVLRNNKISTISNKSCQYLKNHTSLRRIDLESNNLQHFQFGCLPTSIEYVDLRKNNITEINDLSDVPHSRVWLGMYLNPIRCTCSLLRDFVQLLDSGYVTFSGYGQAITCANADSELANYPWDGTWGDTADIKLHDASSLGCLTSGENTDTDID